MAKFKAGDRIKIIIGSPADGVLRSYCERNFPKDVPEFFYGTINHITPDGTYGNFHVENFPKAYGKLDYSTYSESFRPFDPNVVCVLTQKLVPWEQTVFFDGEYYDKKALEGLL